MSQVYTKIIKNYNQNDISLNSLKEFITKFKQEIKKTGENELAVDRETALMLVKEMHDVFTGHTASVLCMCWSPSGMLLATGSGDHTVKLWVRGDSSSDALVLIRTLAHQSTIKSLTFTSEEELICGDTSKNIYVWRINNTNIF